MADPITERTAELEGGLDDLQRQLDQRATAPPQPLPSQVQPPAAPPVAEPEEDNQQEGPLTWGEVRQTPEYNALSPEKRLITFARWHDDAFNHASAQPDWAEHKDAFNTKAAETQNQLEKDAGGLNPQSARVKIATDAIAGVPDGQAQRDVLAKLGPDIRDAYFKQKQEPDTAADDWNFGTGFGTDVVKAGLATMAQSVIGAAKGAVRFVTPPLTAKPGDIGYDQMKAANDSLKGFGDFLNTWKEEVPKGVGVKEDSGGAQVGQFFGGLVPYFLALPAAVVAHVGERYGDTFDKSGSKTQAGASAALAGVTDLLFMELGKVTSGLAKGIKTPVARWAASMAAGTGGNISVSQLAKAGEAALDAPSDQRYAAFKKAFTDIKPSEVGIQAAFAGLATRHAEQARGQEKADAIKDKTETIAQNLTVANSPKTAQVVREAGKQAAAVAEVTPTAELHTNVDKDGNPSFTQNLPADLTPEQLRGWDAHILGRNDLPEPVKAQFRQEIADAIDAAETKFAPPKPTPKFEKAEGGGTAEVGGGTHRVLKEAPPAPAETKEFKTATEANKFIKDQGDALVSHTIVKAKGKPVKVSYRLKAEPKAVKATPEEVGDTSTDTPPKGERLVTIQRADGSTYEASYADKEWDVAGKKTPAIARKTADGWSHGLLEPGEKIVEQPAKPKAAKPAAKIAGPALTDKEGNVLAEGPIGTTHAEHTKAAIEKMLADNPGADPGKMLHQFRDTEGNILSRKIAWKLAKAAGQIRPDVLKAKDGPDATLQSQDLITPVKTAASAAAGKPGKETIDAAVAKVAQRQEGPGKEALDALVGKAAKENPRSEEQKAAAAKAGKVRAHAFVGKTGILPDWQQLRRYVGGDSTAAKELKGMLQKRIAEKWPPAAIPKGAEITVRKFTGEPVKDQKNIPDSIAIKSVVLPPDERGIRRVEPYFTNDPNHEARALASGERVYVPDELVGADDPKTGKRVSKINPAIEPYLLYDHVKDQYYVGGVDTNLGHVDRADTELKPGDKYADLLNRATVKAQKFVSMAPEELQAVKNTVDEVIAEHGISDLVHREEEAGRESGAESGLEEGELPRVKKGEDEEAPPAEDTNEDRPYQVDPESGETSWSEGLPGSPESVKATSKAFNELGFYDPNNKTKVQTGVERLAKDQSVTAADRALANLILRSPIDLTKADLQLYSDPQSGDGAEYTTDGKLIRMNLAADHVGGAKTSFLHEVLHHITLEKLDADYARNPVEEKAYQNIKRFYDTVKDYFDRYPDSEADYGRDIYGLTNIHEFLTETLTNKRFANLVDQFERDAQIRADSTKDFSFTARFFKMIKLFKQNLKDFIAGETVRPHSLLDDALENMLSFIAEGEAQPGRLRNPQLERAASLTAEGKAKMADADRRAIERNKKESLAGLSRDDLEERAGVDSESAAMFSDQELRDMIRGTTDTRPSELSKQGLARAQDNVQGEGWVTPGGKFVKNEGAGSWGGHEDTAEEIVNADPKLAKKFAAYQKEIGVDPSAPSLSKRDYEDFLQTQGFLRVVNLEAGKTFFTGEPRKNPQGIRLLMEHAISSERGLYHDNGSNSMTGLREYYKPVTRDPEAEFVAAKAASAPATGTPAAKIIEKQDKDSGKKYYGLGMDPKATKAQIAGLHKIVDTHPDMGDGVKKALKEQIDLTAEQGNPVLVDKGAGKELIVNGTNASQSMASILSRQKASKIRHLFGGNNLKGEAKKAALQDMNAATWVVEAGGDKHELEIDRERVANSKDKGRAYSLKHPLLKGRPPMAEKYTPEVEYALKNFDRLNEIAQERNKVMNEQLQREQTYGIPVGEVENYVARYLDSPEVPESEVIAVRGTGGKTRFFTKGRVFEKLSDAVAEGFVPKSTNLLELDQRRIEAGERLVQQKILQERLKTILAPDGKPIIGTPESYQTLFQGTQTREPVGYTTVRVAGGGPIVVHNRYVPLIEKLFGTSSKTSGALALYTNKAKQITLIGDTFHIGRVTYKEFFNSKGVGRVGYGKGLSTLEYEPKDLDQALKLGEIKKSEYEYAKANHALVTELVKTGGLNLGNNADNLWNKAIEIPGLNTTTNWIFQKLSRGAMAQTAIANFERNLRRFPELGRDGNLRRTAKEVNEMFGNLQKQSFWKSAEWQNVVRTVFLAPQWAESQLRSELRGYGQFGRAITDAAQGKFRLGVVAQGQLQAALGTFAAVQVASFLMNGHSTFQNKDKRYFELFIPPNRVTGRNGFWFSPLEIAGEYGFMAHRYISQHMNPLDIPKQLFYNKLGPAARAFSNFIGGTDYSGKNYANYTDRTRGAITDLIPMPIPTSAFMERDPRQTLGFRAQRHPGARFRQAVQSFGAKLAYGQTARQQAFELAHPFREDKGYRDNAPAAYRDLRSALDNDQEGNVQSELKLLAGRGHTENQIKAAVGLTTTGLISPEKFAGSPGQSNTTERERAFMKSLTGEQRQIVARAQADHKENARQLLKALNKLKATDPDFAQKLKANKKPVY